MKVLITGITGFVGSHMLEYINDNHDCEVYGITRHRCNLGTYNLVKDGLKKQPIFLEGDISDSHSVGQIVKEVCPDKIFHLAAQSFVPYSWKAPQETAHANVIGTINLLEAVREFAPAAEVLTVGTSEEYGSVSKEDVPIRETTELKPLSPYGVSKVASEMYGYQYFKSYGLKVVRTRAFNHEGPRRGKEFVVSQFIQQAKDVLNGKADKIKVGSLSAIRDFTDVRDVVKAYWLALEKGKCGEVYNICSGIGYTIGEVLEMIMKGVLGGLDYSRIEQDKERMRPSDVPLLIGCCDKFKERTGWVNDIPFEKTIKDMIDYNCR